MEKKIDEFKAIQIETYHGCNRNCKTCPNSVMEKHGELMEEKVYFKILNDLKKRNYRGRISPYGMNEPTLDERLPMFIEETKKMLPDNKIFLGSNGLTIDPAYVTMLLNKGLSQILITCYDEATHEKFRKMEDGQKVRLLIVYDKDLDVIFMNRGGNVKVGPNVRVNRVCSKALTQVFINYKGDMVQCCSDYFDTNVAGNVMDEEVYELWNCKKYKELRQFLAEGQRWQIPLCSKCNFGRQAGDLMKMV